MNRRIACFLLGLPLALSLIGCGSNLPETFPVTGTIMLDGKPVDGATVNFLSINGVTASGKTDASGNFTLKTTVGQQSVEGATLGRHDVAVVKAVSNGMEMGDPKEYMSQMAGNPAVTSDFKTENLIPTKYANPKQSELRAEVKAEGENHFTFNLTS